MNNTIKLRGIAEEDFVNYKLQSMFLITSQCNFKCCVEGGFDKSICQNEPLIKNSEIKEYKIESIYDAYINNPITKAIVVGGLEPFEQFDELLNLIIYFRSHNCYDDFVIYTGFNLDEISDQLDKLRNFPNIVVKFGRYIPNNQSHYDSILGIELASDNQYAMRIS